MSARVLCAAAVALLGCGSDKPAIHLVDAGPDAPVVACNVLVQSGCNAGERCTWVVDHEGAAGENDQGHMGCVAGGTIAAGASCHDATMSTNDDCVSGTVCIAGRCHTICDLNATGTCAGDPGGSTCTGVNGVFDDGTGYQAGECW